MQAYAEWLFLLYKQHAVAMHVFKPSHHDLCSQPIERLVIQF